MTSKIPIVRIDSLAFSTYCVSEVRALSVKEATHPQTFDTLLHATIGGLHDPAYGATDKNDICGSCGENFVHCEGHFGHIELPLPVFNPVYFKTLIKILRGSCFKCRRMLASATSACLLIHQIRVLQYGLLREVGAMEEIVTSLVETCGEGTLQLEAEVQGSLAAYVEEKVAGLSKVSDVKNLVDIRQKLIDDFIKAEMVSGYARKKCPHCKAPIKVIRTEQNCKLIKNITTQEEADLVKKYQDYIRKKKLAREREYDENVDDVEMEEPPEPEASKETKKTAVRQVESMKKTYLTPTEAMTHFKLVWQNDAALLQMLFGTLVGAVAPVDVFFLDAVPVSPSRYRPPSMMNNLKYEHPHTANLGNVLRDCVIIRTVLSEVKRLMQGGTEALDAKKDHVKSTLLESLSGDTIEEKLSAAWVQLQSHVNCILDSDLDKVSTVKHAGIKQRLEKKEGLLRMHMMGKRVNYAARSVISPDPCISTNEVGIPKVFAMKLTYPETVTPWNVHEMRQAVINGPSVHPGASIVVSEDGRKTLLNATNKIQREALAKQLLTPCQNREANVYGCKIVYRHLRNGDLLLINRQPTLHRPSIQAHKARVLPEERTIRLHYANCKAYNADFDGDEMNAHFVQSQDARSEALNIMKTDWQYLTPKDGTPLAGLIQDHVVSGVALTIRGNFFTREDYQQLVYQALVDQSRPITTLPPSIIKPCPLWSGKQVLSTVLINTIGGSHNTRLISLDGRTKISEKSWVTGVPRFTDTDPPTPCVISGMGESEVIIRHGHLLCGVLDKAHYGATQYGLVHSVYELYGGDKAGTLLTSLARLFTAHLQKQAFTLGVYDILLTKTAEHRRKKVVRRSIKEAVVAARGWFGLEELCAQDSGQRKEEVTEAYRALQYGAEPDGVAMLDVSVKSQTDSTQNDVTKCCMPAGLLSRFPHNNLQLMVQSGAKGTTVNTMQISCLLGQIELEGHRPPLMPSGKTLPSFEAYDTSVRAGGFIDGRFLTGIRPQEYYFHCMAGREGLVDTAVKTSRSGYLQRCIIKHLEGLIVNYDLTVRDSDGSVIQFLYGEDGLDVCKTPYLKDTQFPFLITNHRAVWNKETKQRLLPRVGDTYDSRLYDEIERWQAKRGAADTKYLTSGFLHFSRKHGHDMSDGGETEEGDMIEGRSEASRRTVEAWRALSPHKRHKYEKSHTSCPDPPLSYLSPFHHLGVLPEQLASTLNMYKAIHPQMTNEMSKKEFTRMICAKYMQSLSEPGEAVGLLAAQSIGEPSTQMTLNTFHFAGRGEMNVTLGIPRLREIIMVASNEIKTPAMEIPVLPGRRAYKRAKQLQMRLQRIYLKEVLQDIHVTDYLSISNTNSQRMCSRMYRIRFTFLPHHVYRGHCAIKPHQILANVEAVYIKRLEALITQKLKDIRKTRVLNTGSTIQQHKKRVEAVEAEVVVTESDGEADPEGDAAGEEAAARRDDTRGYEGEDEERGAVVEGDDSEGEDMMEEHEGVDEGKDETADTSGSGPSLTARGSTGNVTTMAMGVVDNARVTRVLGSNSNVHSYTYDAANEQWCEVTLMYPVQNEPLDLSSIIQSDASMAVIQQTPGIKRCFLTDKKLADGSTQYLLKTDGLNMQKMYQYADILDVNRLQCNDVQVVARVYGIEAAARVLIREIQSVFAVYGITVDYRHLSLVTDYMTFTGRYEPCNRHSMMANASPLQKMTFETSMNFLKNAALHGHTDKLDSPSARIVTGRVVKGGTGFFDVIYPLVL